MTSSYIIIGTFLISTLILGLFAGRNVKTMEDYILANRSLNTPVLIMTLLATFIASGHIHSPDWIVRYGSVVLLDSIFFIVGFLLMGLFIAPKMVYFQGCMTIGDLMREFYGRYAAMITSALWSGVSIVIISSQIQAMGHFSTLFLDVKFSHAVLFLGLLVVLYSSVGGMRSVAYTDVVQFIAILILLVVLSNLIVHRVGGIKSLFQKVPKEKLNPFNENFYYRLKSSLFWSLFPTFLINPPIIMRMLMVRDKREVKKMFFATTTIYTIIKILLALIGFGAIVYFNDSNYAVNQKEMRHVIPILINNFFIKGSFVHCFMFLGLLFLLMSTADSFLHATGVLLVHDLIKPLSKNRGIEEIKWAKWTTFFVGICAIAIATQDPTLSIYYNMTMLASGIVTVPLILGIIGLKTNSESFLSYSAVFCIILAIIVWWGKLGRFVPFFISVDLASLAFLISHIKTNKGLVMVQRSNYRGDSSRFLTWLEFISWIKSFMPTPKKLVKSSQMRVYKYGSEPQLFSIFFICIVPLVLLAIPLPKENILVIGSIYGVGISLCCALMLEVLWPKAIKPYFDLYWFFTLLYCVPFSATLLFLSNPEHYSSMVGLLIALILLMACVDWLSFLALTVKGIVLALISYRYYMGYYLPVLSFDVGWNLLITFSALLIVGYLFAYRKELYCSTRIKKTRLFGSSIAHETRNYMGGALHMGRLINRAVEKKEIRALREEDMESKSEYLIIPKALGEQLKWLGKLLLVGGEKTCDTIDLFLKSMRDNIIGAKRSNTSLRAIIEKTLKEPCFGDERILKGLVLELEDDFKAIVLSDFFKHILYNLVRNAYYHGGATKVNISLNSNEKTLKIRDNGRGIPQSKLNSIFELFYSEGKGSGIGLALVKTIVETAGGTINCSSKEGENSYTEFTIHFEVI